MILHKQAKESQGTVPGTKGGVALTGWLLSSLGLLATTADWLFQRYMVLGPLSPALWGAFVLFGTGTLVESMCSSATDHPSADLGLCHRVVILEGAKVLGGRQTQCSEVIASQDHWGEQPPKENPNHPWAELSERCQTETDVNDQFSSVPSLEPVLSCSLALFYSAI